MLQSEQLSLIADKISVCTKCDLCKTRNLTVSGEGNNAKIAIIGEGPGKNEDLVGRPFCGAAGQLLDQIIKAMGFDRSEIFITNIVKCRPPNNRVPTIIEAAACRPYLDLQLKVVNPKYIICLGKSASYYLLKPDGFFNDYSMNYFRGKFHDWNGKKVICTYHPSYILHTPEKADEIKRQVWSDLQILLEDWKNSFTS